MTQNDSNKKSLRAFNIIVGGRVQGVGFRYWTQSLANSLGVKGEVFNRLDYSVEIIAEADTDTLGEFIYALKHEHPYARIDSFKMNEIKVQGFSRFKITKV